MSTDPTTPPPAGALAREVELTLQLDPADLARVADLPLLRGRADGPPVTGRLHTVYYDTPDGRLFGRGVALRLRDESGRRIQGLKTVGGDPDGDSAGVAVRREWEWPLDGAVPDLRLLDAEGAGALVPEEIRGDLAPVFETDLRRTVFTLRPDALTAVEVAIDDGAIIADGRRQPISEVELELKSGRIGRLFDLALELQGQVPVRIATESKAERGRRLLTGEAPQPVAAAPLALSPLTTVAEAFRHIVRNCLRHMLANEACALAGGDVEGVHQIRVALRRLRTALRLFGDVISSPETPRLRAEARWLADRLGPVRDRDVVLAMLDALAADDPPPGLGALAAAVRADRARPAAEARAAIGAPRAAALVLDLGAWLEEGRWHAGADAAARDRRDRPMAEPAGAWLAARHARALRTGRPPAGDGRERARRHLRRLRYAAEFFRGLYPAAAVRPLLDSLDALLDALDALHDIRLARDLLARIAASDTDAAVAAVVRRLDKRAARHRKALPDLWAAFREAPRFWG
ncbi:CYTH and CHAD domain-containing protein [Azospirillum halopraeferens]|uniref:CYTH and CHAD domain-containing protein n=1 Tax=Azospirillum halopraeferens TaxID=34010 RepID=UPI00054DDE3B|nr:CYTH and CHAD domain-containing protein [Azospirillum halopraeferens]